ncbi:STAS/SEC14 domain-containing protein [Thalassoglobus sp. JC818]|uniref:STAS/SEC14 domain-containing protein n=1 Tax=Thalassoglobus sp. JC818 TaxID=3232136 RepID=UPI00345906A1
MLNVEVDHDDLIAILTPDGALDASDFQTAAREIDPVIEQHGMLNGLVIYVRKFPGWDSFSAITSHFEFVKQHHRKVRCVALVTDSSMADIAEKLASHFVAAEIKHFPYSDLSEAKTWIRESAEGVG